MQRSINKILIANRGEIARRIMRTCRDMGIATVAVFSDADADAPFVHEADEAVRIGPAPSAQSYLDIDRILAAAKRTHADAIHPGYGFLAENGDFAEACAGAGVVFIGPSAAVIRKLGSKIEARRIAEAAGVPVIPAYSESGNETEMQFPVLLKASTGGGGRGMRIVRAAGELANAMESAKREAKAAFGDDTMLIERYIDRPRHIEFQILADHHGNAVHLFERDCSIQRRYQKIIEESPSPALDAELRTKMGDAAVAIAKSAGYENAGTVEMILAPDKSFYFLEVNTRLQVEHPVTEMVTGLDLVREQIRIARGELLGYQQSDLSQRGAAIECRLYAENSELNFLPTTGTIVDWHVPSAEDVRVDSGIDVGSHVGIHYDAMLAKVICCGATRAEALAKMRWALSRLAVQGLVTNRELLLRILAEEEFASGEFDTHYLERHPELKPNAPSVDAARDAAIAATVASYETAKCHTRVLASLTPGFRNNHFADAYIDYSIGEHEITVHYRNIGEALQLTIGDDSFEVHVVGFSPPVLTLERDGHRCSYRVARRDDLHFVQHGAIGTVVRERPRFPQAEAESIEGGCTAPMPGKVIRVATSEGDAVRSGQTLVVLEAMKMEHAVKAPQDGVIAQLCVSEGDQVDADALLVVVKSAS